MAVRKQKRKIEGKQKIKMKQIMKGRLEDGS